MIKPFIVGIAGGSGSGKTFFLRCFLNHFSPFQVSLISQDDYYHPVQEMTAEENKLYNFDLPSTIDHEHFLAEIKKIISGETVYKKEYTFNQSDIVPQMLEIRPAPILIVEGLFILHFTEIADLLDLKIFMDTEEDIALQRRLRRDFIERGYSGEDVLYKWVNHVVPACKQFLLPYKNTCDKIIINNTEVAEDMMKISEEISTELREKILSKRI